MEKSNNNEKESMNQGEIDSTVGESINDSQEAGKSKVHRSDSHSSQHHHHHHSRSKSKKKFKFSSPFSAILATIAVIALIVVLIFLIPKLEKNSSYVSPTQQISTPVFTVSVEDKYTLVNPAIVQYLDLDITSSYYKDTIPSQLSTSGRIDAEYPVVMNLSFSSIASAEYFVLEYADNEELANATRREYAVNQTRITLPHLLTNTTYYYRVSMVNPAGVSVQTGSFQTADTPRILSIDGIRNIRDIGNWRTTSGKRIQQGLLYRGTELDGAVVEGYHVTNDGLMDMLLNLKIKTDIDLRAQTPISMDALGSRVQHYYYDMVMYSGIFSDSGKEKIYNVFSDLANPDNYPVYMHCTYGADRTGTVCYLLEALLGVSEVDCIRDYGLSNLKPENILAIQQGLNEYSGNTLKDKTASYLISCGITVEQINSIRNIFLGE